MGHPDRAERLPLLVAAPPSGVVNSPFVFAHGFFVAWSPTGDLDDARVTITTKAGDRVTSTEPTLVSGTFEPAQFNDACVRAIESGTRPFVGDPLPAIEVTHDHQVFYVYVGNSTEICDFMSTATQHGIDVNGYYQQDGGVSYGMNSFVGETGAGFVVGRVPDSVTSVQIVANGTTIQATVARGVFGAWVPANVYGKKHAKVIAVSPPTIYTIVGGHMTKTPTR